MVEREEVLKRIYYDPESAGAFGGANRLHSEALKEIPDLKLVDVKKWLKGESTYTMFRPRKRRFKRLKILVGDIDEQWQADLLDMSWFAQYNNGYKYLLVVIDVFSKYAWVVPLKSKDAGVVVRKFKNIILKGRKPEKLQTDQGKEFKNKIFETLMQLYDINFFTTTDDAVKCAVVERFNRTLRERIYRYLYHKNSHRYIDELDNLVDAYNKSYHRTIDMAPAEVTSDHSYFIRDRNREKHTPPKKKAIPEGDHVRISQNKGIFEKGAMNNWSEEVFKIDKRKRTPLGYVYRLVDLADEPITSIFYSDELNPVKKPEFFNIKELKTRINPQTNKRQVYVHWIGYPKKFDQWINEEDIQDINEQIH